jgi:hypothetical protein
MIIEDISNNEAHPCEEVQSILFNGFYNVFQIEQVRDHIEHCSICEEVESNVKIARDNLSAEGFNNYIDVYQNSIKRNRRCNSDCIHSGSIHKEKSNVEYDKPKLQFTREELCNCGTIVERAYYTNTTSSAPYPITPPHVNVFDKLCAGDFSSNDNVEESKEEPSKEPETEPLEITKQEKLKC